MIAQCDTAISFHKKPSPILLKKNAGDERGRGVCKKKEGGVGGGRGEEGGGGGGVIYDSA